MFIFFSDLVDCIKDMYYLHSVESPMLLLKRFSRGCVHSYARIIIAFSTIIFLEFPPNSVPKEVCFWKSYRHIYFYGWLLPREKSSLLVSRPRSRDCYSWSDTLFGALDTVTVSGILDLLHTPLDLYSIRSWSMRNPDEIFSVCSPWEGLSWWLRW